MARALRGCDGADGVAAGWVGHGPEDRHAQEDHLGHHRDRHQGAHRHSHRHRHHRDRHQGAHRHSRRHHLEVRQGGDHQDAERRVQDGQQILAEVLQEEADAHLPQGAEGSACH